MTLNEVAAQYGLPGLVLAVLAAAGGRYLESWLKARDARKSAAPPEMIRRADADASMLSMSQARTGLEKDLADARALAVAERAQHAADLAAEREVTASERRENTRLRRALAEEEARSIEREKARDARIEALEHRVRELLTQLSEALDELAALKRGTGSPA